jgi:hypothetical protein
MQAVMAHLYVLRPLHSPLDLLAALRDMHGSDGPSASRGWSERIMTRSKVRARAGGWGAASGVGSCQQHCAYVWLV